MFIHTEEVVGEDRPNIRLRLYQEDPTTNVRTLLQEVNDPASEFSTIVENLVPGLNAFLPYTYYVEVINDEGGNWPSHYIITISYDQAGGNGGNGGTLTGATQGPNGWVACSGGQLELANIPAGCTVTWSTTDAQTSSVLSSNGSLATQPVNSPGFMLRATATVVCGGVSIQNYQVEVWYGPPAVPSLRAGGVVCLREEGELGSQITFAPNDLLFATDNGGADPGFFFEIYNSNGNLVESGTVPTANQAEYHPMMASLNAGQYTAMVTVQNACGAAQNRVRFQVDHCTEPGLESFGRAFPNPTNDWVTFELEDEIPLSEAGLHLKLYDNIGSLRLEKQENSREVSLNLYELPAGLYSLHVHNGEQFMQVQVVKE